MLEETDQRIVSLLQRDGRISFTDLARAVGLSVSAVHQRVRRLELRGVIRGYGAVVDSSALGLELTAFVALTPVDAGAPDSVPGHLVDIHEVEACHSVAGTESYLLKVRTHSPATLESLLAELRQRCGMATRTTVVLSTPFEGRPCELPAGPGSGVGTPSPSLRLGARPTPGPPGQSR